MRAAPGLPPSYFPKEQHAINLGEDDEDPQVEDGHESNADGLACDAPARAPRLRQERVAILRLGWGFVVVGETISGWWSGVNYWHYLSSAF